MRKGITKDKYPYQYRDTIVQDTAYFLFCALFDQLRCKTPELIVMHNTLPKTSRSEDCCSHHLTASKIPDILLVGKIDIILKLFIYSRKIVDVLILQYLVNVNV